MAGSRLEKLGTIFTRVTGLLKSGALKREDKPIWYDVYEAFPPKYEPNFNRPSQHKEIMPIFYAEDGIRAKFYGKYGKIGLFDMINPETETLSQKFLNRYKEFKSKGTKSEELFETTEKSLLEEGILFKPANRISKFGLKDLIEEKTTTKDYKEIT